MLDLIIKNGKCYIDKDLKDVFPGDYPTKQLDLFRQTLEKEQERS